VEDVPRAFRGYPFAFDGPGRILKVPRNIERRDASPRMHLYDQMLIPERDRLTILQRLGDGHTVSVVPSATIAAVEFGTELLQGWIAIHVENGSRVDIAVNASARDTLADIAHALVETAAGPEASDSVSDRMPLDALGAGDDVAFVNGYRSVSLRRPGLHVSAAYRGRRLRVADSWVARLRRGPARLSGAVFARNDRYLVSVSRREWLKRGTTPDLSLRTLLVARARVTGIEACEHPTAHGVTTVELLAGAARIEYLVPTDSDTLTALRASLPETATRAG
jgi:hypothetical protein